MSGTWLGRQVPPVGPAVQGGCGERAVGHAWEGAVGRRQFSAGAGVRSGLCPRQGASVGLLGHHKHRGLKRP